jgi:hypothetical protein
MYGWVWAHLPGNWLVKTFFAALIVVGAALVLWFIVFPWAEPLLPFGDVTVGNH